MLTTDHIRELEEFQRLEKAVRAGQMPCALFAVPEAAKPHIAAALGEATKRPVIVVTATDDKAEQYAAAVPDAVFIPKRALQLRASVARSRERMFERIRALSKLAGGARLTFVSGESLAARLVPPEDFLAAHIRIEKDGRYDPEKLIQKLVWAGYERVNAVETAGQAARRGEILDVFCPGAVAPYRIDFFDDVVESIHSFDPVTQRRSREKFEAVTLAPAVELTLSDEAAAAGRAYFEAARPDSAAMAQRFASYAQSLSKGRYFEDIENFAYAMCSSTVLDYVREPLVLLDDYKHIRSDEEERREDFEHRLMDLVGSGEAVADQKALYLPLEDIIARASGCVAADFCTVSRSGLRTRADIVLPIKSAVAYSRKLDLLQEDLKARVKAGWRVYLFCGNTERAERLAAELSDKTMTVPLIKYRRGLQPGETGTYPQRLTSGFELTPLKVYFLGEHEIYGFARKRKPVSTRRQLDLFADLRPGDLVVHDVHGKGRFIGLVKREVQKVSRDYLELEYRDGDKLFIPTDQIDRVQKYMGGDNERLSKLGGREWAQTKARVKKAVKELAEDLISIYSERMFKKGYKYGEDTIWQRQFEDSFPYEETEGQLKSIAEIKKDMQQEKVMDRLLLGDVGYGKTEVAMRACFKAVMEGKQCAVLVPTTLLARQHYHTFQERFADFAVRIEMISRYVSAGDQARILEGLKNGTVDIVIGTHRLLSKDVVFKDLGLLVIDEEQRFGVSHKERIKDIRRTVDVLTLSATPIPRTLQMALTGIRDMSVLDTPPDERRAPESYVMEYSGQLLRDAVMREMERGGQVYFVCRQISQMDRLAQDLRRYAPEARVALAHGRMGEAAMEDVMVRFLAGEYDVLLCTTIIESGIDIPNVNTVIVYEADKFGLAQLYQIKGRVGRGAKSSYAYLTYLPGAHMTPEAEKRLATIAEFTELGAGFKIAMRDLEIRGAGNLLGPEQSGHMAAVGYDMYCRLMREAVAELKGERVEKINETSVEIGLPAHVPSEYIDDDMLRIEVYKKIAAIDSVKSARAVKEEIIDRYGTMPRPVENLILIALIKAYANAAGILSVTRRGRTFTLKYGEGAAVEIEALLAVLSEYPGMAQLKAAEPPYIVFKAGKNAVDELLRFLTDIRRCVKAQ
ncbi:MAG: transcription-repair coupling factor [Christensenellaceae bacterium]|nr:transcription-repair coupling factor [Christensenellaceae bacterium]